MDILLKRRLLSGADRWLVAEVDARGIPGALADRCLVFQSEHVARKLWQYPANWHSLSDYALAALGEGQLADVAERPGRPNDRPAVARRSLADAPRELRLAD